MTITYHVQVGQEKGDYDGRLLFADALVDAYYAARETDEPVTLFRAAGPDDELVFEPLAVISALPIVSAAVPT